MKTWFANLDLRERRALIFGGGALLLFLFYFLGWQPFTTKLDQVAQQVREQRATYQWMQAKAEEVRRLRSAAPAIKTAGGQSLLATVDRTAREGGLGPALKRVEPESASNVRVWLDGATFDGLVKWLLQLQHDYGIQIVSISVDRQNDPGIVSARLTLAGGAR